MNSKQLRTLNLIIILIMVIMVIQILMVKFVWALVILGAYQVGSLFKHLLDYMNSKCDSDSDNL